MNTSRRSVTCETESKMKGSIRDEAWIMHPVGPRMRVRVHAKMPKLPTWLDSHIDRLWAEAQGRLQGVLFNGRVFCLDRLEPNLIEGHWTEYRRVVAQIEHPSLFVDLAIRSLAVNGMLSCPQGVVLGRRPDEAIYQAGLWQLAPAGSVDPSASTGEGWVDIIAQAATELREELGLEFSAIETAVPVGVVEHAASHVCDLGVALSTSLSGDDIQKAHSRLGNAEYTALEIVSRQNIPGFAERCGDTLARQSRMFLENAGWLPAQDGGALR